MIGQLTLTSPDSNLRLPSLQEQVWPEVSTVPYTIHRRPTERCRNDKALPARLLWPSNPTDHDVTEIGTNANTTGTTTSPISAASPRPSSLDCRCYFLRNCRLFKTLGLSTFLRRSTRVEEHGQQRKTLGLEKKKNRWLRPVTDIWKWVKCRQFVTDLSLTVLPPPLVSEALLSLLSFSLPRVFPKYRMMS